MTDDFFVGKEITAPLTARTADGKQNFQPADVRFKLAMPTQRINPLNIEVKRL